ncbi:hypothetical protein PR202_ga04666 [Eleusine coracana subsp. coracana]|uniref:Uncharacterized protein n=1 Tax=Eleusine coracana subsp. coracana TaxID=191504 RepID=A0AAV5BQH1_ELECO|nr:hypothetical protein PR202_ga04666 [Eleusine coracana subsp. coracana]
MREEEEPSWFARCEEQLPRPDELMPISQTLITPDLAVAFDPDIHARRGAGGGAGVAAGGAGGSGGQAGPDMNGGGGASSAAGASGGGGGGAGDEPARTLKRPRLVWTPQLHKRGWAAAAAAEEEEGGGGGSHSSGGSGTDAATEHLFATGPVPFLPPGHGHRGPAGAGGAGDPYPPFAAPMGHHHHHHHHPPPAADRPLPPPRGPPARPLRRRLRPRVPQPRRRGGGGGGAPPVGPHPGMHHHHRMAPGMGGMMAPGAYGDELDLGSRGGGGGRRGPPRAHALPDVRRPLRPTAVMGIERLLLRPLRIGIEEEIEIEPTISLIESKDNSWELASATAAAT